MAFTVPEIRAALRRHLVTVLSGVTVTLPDATTAAPKVVAYKSARPQRAQDFPLIVVRSPKTEYGKADDGLEYRGASLVIELVLYLSATGGEPGEREDVMGLVADAMDEGFLLPVQREIKKVAGILNKAGAGDPLCSVRYPEFTLDEMEVEGEGGREYVVAGLRVQYPIEAVYERISGGAPPDDFATLTGPIDTGEPEAGQQVVIETQQP